MDTHNEHHVRAVQVEDLERLAEVETLAWGKLPGAVPLDLQTLHEWFAQGSSYFLVAITPEGKIHGYIYSVKIAVNETFDELRQIMLSEDLRTFGVINLTPTSDGNTIFNVSVTSISTRAAEALHNATLTMTTDEQVLYIAGISRLSNFAAYLAKAGLSESEKAQKHEAARWYTNESIRLTNKSAKATTQTNHNFPPIRRPDAAVRYNVNGINFQLVDVVEMVKEDKKSSGMGALLVSRYPHRVE